MLDAEGEAETERYTTTFHHNRRKIEGKRFEAQEYQMHNR